MTNTSKRYCRWIALVAGILASSCSQSAPLSLHSQDADPISLRQQDVQNLLVEGRVRRYRLYIPAGYRPTQPIPLVVAFHPFLFTSRLMEQVTEFNEIAEAETFIVAYPDGEQRRWNDAFPPGAGRPDDLAFVDGLLDELTQRYAIDPQRIYAAGYSDGAFFSARLVCERAERFAAVGLVAASMARRIADTCTPSRPVPTIQLKGTADRIVPYDGFPGYLSTPEMTDLWVRLNGCHPIPTQLGPLDQVNDGTTVTQFQYQGCLAQATVELYQITDGGHTWPGNMGDNLRWVLGLTSKELNGSQTLWTFFENHPQPAN